MPNYVKFQDVAAVITAGGQLSTSGDQLGATLQGLIGAGGSIRTQEGLALRGTDSYSQEFKGTYRAAGEDGKERNESLMSAAKDLWDKNISTVGKDVVTAATELLWVDAVNGQAMSRALSQGQG